MSNAVEKKLKWFLFQQNNSGGLFHKNEYVAEYVFVQAKNARFAEVAVEDYLNNSDSCPCCGDRWNGVRNESGSGVPMIYGKRLDDYVHWWGNAEARLHYDDGRIEKVLIKGKEKA